LPYCASAGAPPDICYSQLAWARQVLHDTVPSLSTPSYGTLVLCGRPVSALGLHVFDRAHQIGHRLHLHFLHHPAAMDLDRSFGRAEFGCGADLRSTPRSPARPSWIRSGFPSPSPTPAIPRLCRTALLPPMYWPRRPLLPKRLSANDLCRSPTQQPRGVPPRLPATCWLSTALLLRGTPKCSSEQ